MSKKKVSEMTFKEFIDKAGEKGEHEIKPEVLPILKKEGFSEEQIYNMKMGKVWKLYLAAVSDDLTKRFDLTIKRLVQNPAAVHSPMFKAAMKMMEKVTKELEELMEEDEQR